MRLGSQKRKIISLVLVFGCIYAVNACAHPLAGSFTFHISNQAPKSDFGDITISSDSEPTKPCKDSSGILVSIDIPSLGAGSTDSTKISIQYGSINDYCYADIQYGGKYTTKVKITWVAATDGGNGAVFHSITTKNGDPLGSDNAFTDWSLTITSNNNGLLMTVPTSPLSLIGHFTLTYAQAKKSASAIRLTNNNTASGSYISFNQPDPSLSQNPNHCSFIAKQDDGKDPPVLNQVRAKPGESKTVYFMPFTKGFTSCQMEIDTKFDQQSPDSPTRVIVEHKNPKDTTTPLTVKIDTTEDTPGFHALADFNARNNNFAVKHGAMMQLGFTTPGVVNYITPLPFPLLKTTPIDISLDYLANELLKNDLSPPAKTPTIFDDYKSNKKTSRDIALDMLIAAGMMKAHSQDSTNLTTWSQHFSQLYDGLTHLIQYTDKSHTQYEFICTTGSRQCYLPLQHFKTYDNGYTSYCLPNDGNTRVDDTLSQIYLAAAFQIASKALIDKGDTSGDSTTYSDISQWIQDAILDSNRPPEGGKWHKKYYSLLNGTRKLQLDYSTSYCMESSDGGVSWLLPHASPLSKHEVATPTPNATTTYSDSILPFIHMFSLTGTTQNKKPWTEILANTVNIEMTLITNLSGQNDILGSGKKLNDPIVASILGSPGYGTTVYSLNGVDDKVNPGDIDTDLTKVTPSLHWSFGGDDDADYVPMSLGAYLLVAGDDETATDNLTNSGTILNKEMGAIDEKFLSKEKFIGPYKRFTCSMDNGSWTCGTPTGELTPLDMSSYLLAQLGLDAHFGRTDDYPPTDSPVDNSAQIADLTKSFGSKIKRYVKAKGTDNPMDISTLSPIILAGLYIDDAFKPTPTDGTSFNNPLIDAHLNKSGDIHYYFTLDPSTSSTLGAQVRSGAQTSYRGE